MRKTKRIAIIGNAGSGKSTLARKLQQIVNLPIYHLDKYFWKPNWENPDPAEYKIVHDTLCDQDEWILDGMNLRFLEYRAERAEVIIFLNLPRYSCFWRIFKRVFTYYGSEAPSSAQGCPERINARFIKFLKWVWDFKKRYPGKISELFKKYEDTKKIYILRSQKEIDQFLEKVSAKELL
jgi:adenylate kinase family enzyme